MFFELLVLLLGVDFLDELAVVVEEVAQLVLVLARLFLELLQPLLHQGELVVPLFLHGGLDVLELLVVAVLDVLVQLLLGFGLDLGQSVHLGVEILLVAVLLVRELHEGLIDVALLLAPLGQRFLQLLVLAVLIGLHDVFDSVEPRLQLLHQVVLVGVGQGVALQLVSESFQHCLLVLITGLVHGVEEVFAEVVQVLSELFCLPELVFLLLFHEVFQVVSAEVLLRLVGVPAEGVFLGHSLPLDAEELLDALLVVIHELLELVQLLNQVVFVCWLLVNGLAVFLHLALKRLHAVLELLEESLQVFVADVVGVLEGLHSGASEGAEPPAKAIVPMQRRLGFQVDDLVVVDSAFLLVV